MKRPDSLKLYDDVDNKLIIECELDDCGEEAPPTIRIIELDRHIKEQKECLFFLDTNYRHLELIIEKLKEIQVYLYPKRYQPASDQKPLTD